MAGKRKSILDKRSEATSEGGGEKKAFLQWEKTGGKAGERVASGRNQNAGEVSGFQRIWVNRTSKSQHTGKAKRGKTNSQKHADRRRSTLHSFKREQVGFLLMSARRNRRKKRKSASGDNREDST